LGELEIEHQPLRQLSTLLLKLRKGFNIQLAKTKGGGKKEVINTKKEVPTSGDLCRKEDIYLKGGIYSKSNICAIA